MRNFKTLSLGRKCFGTSGGAVLFGECVMGLDWVCVGVTAPAWTVHEGWAASVLHQRRRGERAGIRVLHPVSHPGPVSAGWSTAGCAPWPWSCPDRVAFTGSTSRLPSASSRPIIWVPQADWFSLFWWDFSFPLPGSFWQLSCQCRLIRLGCEWVTGWALLLEGIRGSAVPWGLFGVLFSVSRVSCKEHEL